MVNAKAALGQIPREKYRSIREQANPFEKIGRSIFMNRAGVKLVNLDAVFGLTGHSGGLLAQQTAKEFTFADIAGAPGAFSQYLLYRNPEAYGYAISLKTRSPSLRWKTDLLDLSRLNITYGEDDTGDLYTNADWFANWVRKTAPSGVDLVTADGGFEVKNRRKQEILSFRLIMVEVLTALQILKSGPSEETSGRLVLKLFDTVTLLTGELIFLLTLAFKEINIIKPITSRPANAEKYLVARGIRRERANEIVLFLRELNSIYQSGRIVTQLVNPESIPECFFQYLRAINQQALNNQLIAIRNIGNVVKGIKLEIPIYNLPKSLIIWNVPGNEEVRRRYNVNRPIDTPNTGYRATIAGSAYPAQRDISEPLSQRSPRSPRLTHSQPPTIM